MHWKKLISYVRYLPELAGVEVHLQPGQTYQIRLAKLRRKGRVVSYTGGESEVPTWAGLADKVSRDVPVAVFLSGTGIIHRVAHTRDDPAGNSGWMAHADPNDLYLQQTSLGEGRVLYSYIKRAEADRVLAAFRKVGLEVLSLSLGPFAVLPLLPNVDLATDAADFSVGIHRFILTEGRCQGYEAIAAEQAVFRSIQIGGEIIDERLFPTFAQGFCAISDIPVPELPIPALHERVAEHREKWQFKRTVWAVLAFFLAVLLINAWVFLSVSRKLKDQGPTDLLQQKAEVALLKENLEGREKLWQLVHPGGARTELPLAAVADRLAAALPEAILLQTLTFYPKASAAMGHGQPPRYAFDQIVIRGESKAMQPIQDWLKAIGQMPFCARIQLDRYQVQQDGTGVFDLIIQLP